MKFVKASPPTKPKTKDSIKVAYFYAAILAILVLAQLFTFEKFFLLLEDFGLPGGVPVAHLIGGIIVASEVLALPFLLRLSLSPLMRITSMVLGWVVPAAWFKLSVWHLISDSSAVNIGFLGTIVDLSPGWWSVLMSIAMGILAAWASWGLWPVKKRK